MNKPIESPLLVFIEHEITRDVRVPLVENDVEFNFGWKCIPVLPAPRDGDPDDLNDSSIFAWEIDPTYDDDYKTRWRRIRPARKGEI